MLPIMSNEITYHPLFTPHVAVYTQVVSTLLWRLLTKEEFQRLLDRSIAESGGTDSIGLASNALKLEGDPTRTKIAWTISKTVLPLVTGEMDHHALLRAAGQQLIGHCFELIKDEDLIKKRDHPTGEFFRHVRNGCFHGNRFCFRGNEPRLNAEWRGLSISPELDGCRVFRDSLKEREFFLNHGDVVLLISDVSRLISGIT